MSQTQQTIRAAAYVRMSTERQQYSTNNQMDMIKEYADRRGMDIVKMTSRLSRNLTLLQPKGSGDMKSP